MLTLALIVVARNSDYIFKHTRLRSIELSEFDIEYRPRPPRKGQVVIDFITKFAADDVMTIEKVSTNSSTEVMQEMSQLI